MPTPSPLRWGLLATGNIARKFATDLPRSRTGKLTAVASRDAAKAAKFGEEFGVDAAHCHGSYEALLADAEVDAVYISTPHPLHAQWAIRACEAGKHVLCEKPLALNHSQAMAIVEAVRENDVFLMEAFMYRCLPHTAKLIETIESGAIGKVRMIQASFGFHNGAAADQRLNNPELGGGGILDVGCYPVSLARLIAGATDDKPFLDPKDVHASASIGDTGVDDYAAAILTFPNGVIAQVATGIKLNLQNDVRIFGDAGTIHIAQPWGMGFDGGELSFELRPRGKDPQTITVSDDRPLYAIEADAVGDAVAAGHTEAAAPAMSWQDTLGNMQTLDRWRRAVKLEYPQEKPGHSDKPLHGRPLKRRSDHNMTYGNIAGVDKPISKFFFGCDNQSDYPFASMMWDQWIECGGNAFDTAVIYGGGTPETLLGQWMKSRNNRNDLVITVKGAHTPHCNPDDLTKQLAISLDRLGIDKADLYLMHRDNLDIPVGEFVDILNEHFDAGRIGPFGGSNWTLPRIQEANAYAAKHNKQPMTLLSDNLALARMMKPVWDGALSVSDAQDRGWLEETQTTNLAWSSSARGYFADPDKRTPAHGRSLDESWDSTDNRERRDRAVELAKKKGVTPHNIAVAWVLSQPFPSFALIGPRTPEELHTSLPALDITLTPDELRWLDTGEGRG